MTYGVRREPREILLIWGRQELTVTTAVDGVKRHFLWLWTRGGCWFLTESAFREMVEKEGRLAHSQEFMETLVSLP